MPLNTKSRSFDSDYVPSEIHVWENYSLKSNLNSNPANIYLLKVSNRNARKRIEVISKLTIKTPERRHWRHSGVFIVNFEHISHFFLMFLLLLWTSKCFFRKILWLAIYPERTCRWFWFWLRSPSRVRCALACPNLSKMRLLVCKK